MVVRGGKWAGVPAATLLLVGVALVAVKAPWRGGRDESMQNADLQQVQSLLRRTQHVRSSMENVTFEHLDVPSTVRYMAGVHIFVSVHGAGNLCCRPPYDASALMMDKIAR